MSTVQKHGDDERHALKSTRHSRARALWRPLQGLALACHPGPVVAVTAVAVGYAVARHRSVHGTVLVGLAVLAGQLSVGWQNDALDADRDRRTARLSKPIVHGLVDRSTVTLAAILAGATCVPLSLASGWKAGTVHVGAVTLALAYNLGLKATTLSVVCYAVSFGALPVFVAKGAPGAPFGPWWAATAAAALGVGAHILNTLPDRADDLTTGTLGLPLRLSIETDARIAGAAFFVAAGVVSFGSGQVDPLRLGAFAFSALCGLAIAVISAHDARLAFRLTLLLAVLDVALLLVVSR